MTREEKIEWLEQYQRALNRQEMLLEEIEWLRDDALRLGGTLNGMPTAQGPNTDRLPRALERIEAAQEELAEQIEQCMALRGEIVRTICTLSNTQQRAVLYRRFVLGQTADEIADALCVVTRRVFQLQRAGLTEILNDA